MVNNKANAQYCVTNLGGGGCGGDQITDVQIPGTTLSNLANVCTGTSSNTLTVFPATGNTTATLVQGLSYWLKVTTTVDDVISVWIDYNQDQSYDSSEWSQVSLGSMAVADSVLLTIPFSAITGQIGMRIRSRNWGATNTLFLLWI